MSSDREPADRQRWAELKSLFNAAVERPRQEWPALIASLRARDADLADQLQRLLDGHVEDLIESRIQDRGLLESEGFARGDRLGPYVITGLIGEGGMGRVYRAQDARLGRDVAIKVLPPELAHDAGRRMRMEREARAMGMLNHPNIVTVYDIGDHQGSPFIVTELLEGQTLRGHIAGDTGSDTRIGRRSAVEIVAAVADALGAAHARGIVHRDIKPENVFVTRDGRVKVLDFGIAKLVEAEAGAEATATGAIIGTLGYIAPEQLRGDPPRPQTDVYACGVVLYELLAGTRPFAGRSQAALIAAILQEPVPPLEGVSPSLSALVARCLAKDPSARLASGDLLASALRTLPSVEGAADPDFRDQPTARVDRTATQPAAGRPWRRRAIAVAVGVLLAAAAFFATTWRPQRGDGATAPAPGTVVSRPDAVPAPADRGAAVPEPRPADPPPASTEPTDRPPVVQRPETASPPPGPRKPDASQASPPSPAAQAPPPATASPPAPAPASLVGLWQFTEQVVEDVHRIECTATGALQVRVDDPLLEGTLSLKQACTDLGQGRTETTAAVAALTAASTSGATVSFVTRTVENDVATTCQYEGQVAGAERRAMTGTVTCDARASGLRSQLTLRGTWRASRP